MAEGNTIEVFHGYNEFPHIRNFVPPPNYFVTSGLHCNRSFDIGITHIGKTAFFQKMVITQWSVMDIKQQKC